MAMKTVWMVLYSALLLLTIATGAMLSLIRFDRLGTEGGFPHHEQIFLAHLAAQFCTFIAGCCGCILLVARRILQ